MQCVQKEMNLILHEVDIQQIEARTTRGVSFSIYTKIDHTAFHLEQDHYSEPFYLQRTRNALGLYINFHHIIMDEWSLQRFLQEVFLSMKSCLSRE